MEPAVTFLNRLPPELTNTLTRLRYGPVTVTIFSYDIKKAQISLQIQVNLDNNIFSIEFDTNLAVLSNFVNSTGNRYIIVPSYFLGIGKYELIIDIAYRRNTIIFETVEGGLAIYKLNPQLSELLLRKLRHFVDDASMGNIQRLVDRIY